MGGVLSYPSKILLVAICCCSFSFHPHAQSQAYNIDSLLREFKYNSEIDLRTYDQLFIALHLDYMEELALVGEDLLKRSLREQHILGLHRAADAFGVYFTSKGHFNQAYKVINRSRLYYERKELWSYVMKSYSYLGELFLAWDNPQNAIYWYNKLFLLSKEHPNQIVHYNTINNLTYAYFSANDYAQGIRTLKLNSRYLDMMNIENKSIYYNLNGNYHLHNGEYDSAMFYYKQSITFAQSISDYRSMSNGYANLAICAFYLNNDNALELFERSYEFALRSKSAGRISISLFNMASWHIENENVDQALLLFSESFRAAQTNNSYNNMFDALDEISDIYREQNAWLKLDSVNTIIHELKSKQYNEFINLSNDVDLVDAAFKSGDNNNTNLKILASKQREMKQILLYSLLLLVFVQFLFILHLVRKGRA